jgi:hypothetical protein
MVSVLVVERRLQRAGGLPRVHGAVAEIQLGQGGPFDSGDFDFTQRRATGPAGAVR